MLKNQCRLAFIRRFMCIRAKEKRSLGDIRQLCTKSLNKSILSTNAFGVRNVSFIDFWPSLLTICLPTIAGLIVMFVGIN